MYDHLTDDLYIPLSPRSVRKIKSRPKLRKSDIAVSVGGSEVNVDLNEVLNYTLVCFERVNKQNLDLLRMLWDKEQKILQLEETITNAGLDGFEIGEGASTKQLVTSNPLVCPFRINDLRSIDVHDLDEVASECPALRFLSDCPFIKSYKGTDKDSLTVQNND